MRDKLTKYLKTYPISLILIGLIWYLSLFSPPQTELNQIRFIDKWAHIVMYGGLGLCLWYESLRNSNPQKGHMSTRTIKLLLFPILMGGIIELVQAYCTQNRSGDWMDFFANSCGAILATLIGYGIFGKIIR